MAKALSNAACEAVANNVKGTLAIPHAYGRLQFGEDLELYFRTIIGAGANPNVAACVVIGIEPGWTDRFDLIIGSDLLYEYDRAELLASFVDQHAKPRCMVLILDPGRKHHSRFSNNMIERGYSHQQGRPDDISTLTQPARSPDKLQVHRYTRS